MIPGELNVSGASLFGVAGRSTSATPRTLAWTPHGLDRATGSPRSSSPWRPATRPATWSTASRCRWSRRRSPSQVMQPDGSLAPVTPDAVHDPVRADVQHASRASRCSAGPTPPRYAMFDANAENFAPAQPLLRHQPRAVDQASCSTILQEVRGHPVGQHDGRGLEGQGALRRHRLDPERPEREGRPAAPARSAQVTFPAARAAGARRLALGVRAGAPIPTRPARASVGASKHAACCSATTTSPTPTTPTGSPTPSSRSRASRGSSATSAPQRSLRTRLGLIMISQRLSGTDGYAGDKFNRQQAAPDRVQEPPLRRRAVARPAGRVLQREPDDDRRGRPGRRQRGLPGARAWDLHVNLDSTGAMLFGRFIDRFGSARRRSRPRSTSPTRSTPRTGSTPADPAARRRRSPTRSPTCTARTSRSTPRSATSTTEPRGARADPDPRRRGRPGRVQRDPAPWEPATGYPNIVHGSSFVMVTELRRERVPERPLDPHLLASRRTRTPSTTPTRRACTRRRSGSTRRSATARSSGRRAAPR